MKEYNPNWLQIPAYLYPTLIITGSFGFGKTNAWFNPLSHQPDTDQICL